MQNARDQQQPVLGCLQLKSGAHGLANHMRSFEVAFYELRTSIISSSCELRVAALSTSALMTPTLEDSISTSVNLLLTNTQVWRLTYDFLPTFTEILTNAAQLNLVYPSQGAGDNEVRNGMDT